MHGQINIKSRFVDHLAVRKVAQGAPLGGGSTFIFALNVLSFLCFFSFTIVFIV